MLISQAGRGVDGFVIARIQKPPKIYDVPGNTCIIDEFTVASPKLWQTAGKDLYMKVSEEAKNLKSVQLVIVSHTHNIHKKLFLEQMGLTVASQWHTKKLQ